MDAFAAVHAADSAGSLHGVGADGGDSYTLDKTTTGETDSARVDEPSGGRYAVTGTAGESTTAVESNAHGTHAATFTEVQARGRPRSLNAVAKIVKSLGIRAISHRKFRARTTGSEHDVPVAGNRPNRGFAATGPNRVRVSDAR